MSAQEMVRENTSGHGGSVLYTDGWRAYRRLNEYGYQHHWVNHDLYYCDPSDPSINTNMIEGLWAQIKRWLPRAGSYNLTEYLDLFQWFYQQKLNGKNPFWRLLELIVESNSHEAVNDTQVDEIPDISKLKNHKICSQASTFLVMENLGFTLIVR